MRKAAQCTHGFGGCQLKGRRGKFARRERSSGATPNARSGKTPGHKPRRSAPAAARAHDAVGVKRATKSAPGSSGVRPGSILEGTVSANRAGFGFLRVEGFRESVFLPPGQMRGVMHGDRVRVTLARDASQRQLPSTMPRR